jgi:hypothetical protein
MSDINDAGRGRQNDEEQKRGLFQASQAIAFLYKKVAAETSAHDLSVPDPCFPLTLNDWL